MTDGIDRDHFLDYSAKSKIFNLPKHIQLLRCGSLESEPLTGASRVRRPAIRWSVACRTTAKGHGSGVRCALGLGLVVASGMGPELFDCWMRPAEVVETRRLELLTLSLQRRCSAS